MQEASLPLKENPRVYRLKSSVECVQQFNRKASLLISILGKGYKAVNEVPLQSKENAPCKYFVVLLFCYFQNTLTRFLQHYNELSFLIPGNSHSTPKPGNILYFLKSFKSFDPTFSISKYSVTPRVAHKCHGKSKSLTAKANSLTANLKQIAHGKSKSTQCDIFTQRSKPT